VKGKALCALIAFNRKRLLVISFLAIEKNKLQKGEKHLSAALSKKILAINLNSDSPSEYLLKSEILNDNNRSKKID
jgi:hypothetical protein